MLDTALHSVRKTKIVCTLGPACWSEEGLAALMDAGMNVARFNFSHGDHAGHKAVLDRVRAVAAAKGKHVATMLDTKGPEIRTAMLRGGGPLELEVRAPLLFTLSLLSLSFPSSHLTSSRSRPHHASHHNQAGQRVVLVAVGADYKTWEGGFDADTGVARIGISYEKLCQSLKPGNIVKVGL